MADPVQNSSPVIATPTRNKGLVVLVIVLIVLLLAALGINVWLMMRLSALRQMSALTSPQPTAVASDVPTVTEEEVSTNTTEAYVSVPGPQTYQNDMHGFSFTYPAGLHLVGTGGENGIPVAFLDTEPIQVPSAWDFQLTPVEFRVIPVSDAATIDEAAAHTRSVLKPSTVQLTRVTKPYGGIKLSGTMEIDGAEIGSNTFYFFQLHDGVLQVSYIKDNTSGLAEAQLNEVINSLTITGPDV